METLKKSNVQNLIAIAAFIMACFFGIAGLFIPPQGEVHSSVLYLIAQFLVLASSMFGISSAITKAKKSNS